jgi:septum formation protein
VSGTAHKVYLASRSPRRRELLKQIGVAFEVLLLRERPERTPDVDESPQPGELPDDYVRRVCRDKAATGWRRVLERRLPRLPVLAADTTVCLGARIFGKPADRAEAAAMLAALSGREHRVLTAVALQFDEQLEAAVSESTVRFDRLEAADIAEYVATGEPMDKAGAYAVQGRAAAFIAELRGSYSGVMGLPLHETATLLRRLRMTMPK